MELDSLVACSGEMNMQVQKIIVVQLTDGKIAYNHKFCFQM